MLLREPLIVWAVLFGLSLVAAIVLFKFLDSRATIKRKNWSAGGALAGFLIVLFGSWYAIRPALAPVRQVFPLSVPKGFKADGVLDAGIAFAVPEDWHRQQTPVTFLFTAAHQNIETPATLWGQVTSCSGPNLIMTEAELPDYAKAFQQMFGMMRVRGASFVDSYLGHKESTTPISITFPGNLFSPPTPDIVMNFMIREVYDERNSRCIELAYPDSELGRELVSTLNITDPLP